MGKLIHCELCKIFKFDHATKWYIHKPESDQENETKFFRTYTELRINAYKRYTMCPAGLIA